MEALVFVGLVVALFGALAWLTVHYEIDSRRLAEGDPDRPVPMWDARGSLRSAGHGH